MPRKSKTQSTTRTSPGQPYGMAGEQVAAMEQIPIPLTNQPPAVNAAPASAGAMPAGMAPSGPPEAAQQAEIGQLEQALMDATATPAPTMPAFSAPVTDDERAALAATKSPMQSARQVSPVVQLLQDLAMANMGDEYLEEIAATAARIGY